MLNRVFDWLPRLVLAAIFLTHGWEKITAIQSFASKFKLPLVVAYLVALAELIGSFLILAGALQNDFYTRLGGLFFCIVMLGAIFMVHWPRWEELQFPLLILTTSFVYFLRGNQH